MQRIDLNMTEELVRAIDKVARQENCDRAKVITRALTIYLAIQTGDIKVEFTK
jgi:metal-responsive CopG/Arc/MetJ family transcriptional regulator